MEGSLGIHIADARTKKLSVTKQGTLLVKSRRMLVPTWTPMTVAIFNGHTFFFKNDKKCRLFVRDLSIANLKALAEKHADSWVSLRNASVRTKPDDVEHHKLNRVYVDAPEHRRCLCFRAASDQIKSDWIAAFESEINSGREPIPF